MIQPVVKLHFVERYCRPSAGWSVFMDIDPSEEGRTGSTRQTEVAKSRQARMLVEAPKALEQLARLGVLVGDRQRKWKGRFGNRLPLPKGDRDIIAVHEDRRHLWIVEVEGDSAGQPEGKIYRAPRSAGLCTIGIEPPRLRPEPLACCVGSRDGGSFGTS